MSIKNFCISVKAARNKLGWTQAEMARRARMTGIDVAYSTVQNIEQNRRTPNLQTAIALSVALGVSLDSLINNTLEESYDDRTIRRFKLLDSETKNQVSAIIHKLFKCQLP